MREAGVIFPVEAVPDGAVWAPHHYWALFVGLLACAVVWDDYRRREPVAPVLLLGAGAAGFGLVWPFYPVTGALLAGICPALGAVVAVRTWRGRYPLRWLLVLLVAVAVALDDWVSHSFGVPTPLDLLWKHHIVQFIS